MMAPSPVPLAFDGSSVDGSLFTAITGLARETRWLNAPIETATNAGLGVFAVLMVIAWWKARRRDATAMTLALAAPISVATAFAVVEVIKKFVAETRPCYSLPHDYFVDACPARSDYAFPSGHVAVAAATAAALFLLDRRLSAIAAVFAVLEGFTRVYVGAHYPHDVLGAAVVALPVACLTSVALRRLAVPLVVRLRCGPFRPILATPPPPRPPSAAESTAAESTPTATSTVIAHDVHAGPEPPSSGLGGRHS